MHRQRWQGVWAQRTGGALGDMTREQSPRLECKQEKGVDCGFYEDQDEPKCHYHLGRRGGGIGGVRYLCVHLQNRQDWKPREDTEQTVVLLWFYSFSVFSRMLHILSVWGEECLNCSQQHQSQTDNCAGDYSGISSAESPKHKVA